MFFCCCCCFYLVGGSPVRSVALVELATESADEAELLGAVLEAGPPAERAVAEDPQFRAGRRLLHDDDDDDGARERAKRERTAESQTDSPSSASSTAAGTRMKRRRLRSGAFIEAPSPGPAPAVLDSPSSETLGSRVHRDSGAHRGTCFFVCYRTSVDNISSERSRTDSSLCVKRNGRCLLFVRQGAWTETVRRRAVVETAAAAVVDEVGKRSDCISILRKNVANRLMRVRPVPRPPFLLLALFLFLSRLFRERP